MPSISALPACRESAGGAIAKATRRGTPSQLIPAFLKILSAKPMYSASCFALPTLQPQFSM